MSDERATGPATDTARPTPPDSAIRRPTIGAAAVLAVMQRPSLWCTAVRQAFRLAPNGWWRRAPFIPLPDRRYLLFRLETQYGEAVHSTEPRDLVTYLAWCRSYQRDLRRRRARA